MPFAFCLLPLLAAHAAREGTPVYYNSQPNNANNANAGYYQSQGYSNYVGQSGQKQVVGGSSYSYQVPKAQAPAIVGTMTPNGVALPASQEPSTYIYADYARRNADFRFETGVNSILEWDDMTFNEITLGVRHSFSLRNFDLFVYGEYTYGQLETGGWSVDYDLKPYNEADPKAGIFTISVGDMSGDTNHMRFGVGARHIWDLGGWKLSPSVGYEIFKHNLQMSDHLYPNPGVYLPLMTQDGNYVFGDSSGKYFSVPTADAPNIGKDYYQVCMSPEDIKLVQSTGAGVLDELVMGDYKPAPGAETVPWGVGPGECVIIGGDGVILVSGTTHIYNTTWSGFYVGLELEKQMTLVDKLRFYVQFGMPNYSSDGTWPNRTDWQQNPSFVDKGNNGAYSYRAEMEYDYKLSDRLQLALRVDTHYFHVGKIAGELYISENTTWALNDQGGYACDPSSAVGECKPYLVTTAAHTEQITESLKSAFWQSFGLHLGVKYAF